MNKQHSRSKPVMLALFSNVLGLDSNCLLKLLIEVMKMIILKMLWPLILYVIYELYLSHLFY